MSLADSNVGTETPDAIELIRTRPFACIFSFMAVVFCLLYVFYSLQLDAHKVRLDEKAIGFLIVAILPWVLDRVETLKIFGIEVKGRLDAQNEAINAQDKVIKDQQDLLNAMFWLSMEKDMFDTLKNLIEQPEFTHNPEDKTFYPIVNDQLKELFSRGYLNIDPKNITSGVNIGSGHIVTPLGRQFVEQRKNLEQKLKHSPGVEKLNELSSLLAKA